MAQPTPSRLNYGRAIWTFLLAYLAITVVATAFSFAVAVAMHVTDTMPPLENPAYLLSERLLPFLNLFVWMTFAWVYFKRRTGDELALRRESVALGVLWLVAATVVDYVGFVLIKNPISLSPHDFYIG